MSIEGQGHFFTIYFPGFVCFVLYLAKISGERLQDHWSSGILFVVKDFPTHSLVIKTQPQLFKHGLLWTLSKNFCFNRNLCNWPIIYDNVDLS